MLKSNKRAFIVLILLSIFVINYKITFSQDQKIIDSLNIELNRFLELNDSSEISEIKYKLGRIYFFAENNNQAHKYFIEALKNASYKQSLKIYNLLGGIYWQKADYEESMKIYRKALKISEQIQETEIRPMILNNIGLIYADYGNNLKALEYYKMSLEVSITNQDKKGIGKSYNCIGREYLELDSLDIALEYLNNAVLIFRKADFRIRESNALNNIGNVYLKKGSFDIALKYHKEAYIIRKEKNHAYLLNESYKNLAKVYIRLFDYSNAEKYIHKGIKNSTKINSPKHLKLFYFQLYDLYAQKQNYKNALENFVEYSKIKDSINSLESKNKISELEIQYQSEKKEQKIKLLNTKNKLNSEIISGQKNKLLFLILGSGILIIALIIVLLIYFQRNRAYKMLVKHNIEIANLEKAQLQKKIKHEITNEQQIINDLLSIIEENKFFLNTSCTIDELAKKIDTNRQYLSAIINNKFNSNFSSFINRYRVKEAIKLLSDKEYDKYTIDAIANLSGFNNRATFNTAFKKITGISPSFFKKEQILFS